MSRRIYIVGSLRNPAIPALARTLRGDGHYVFDDWFAAGPEADDIWRCYEIERARDYVKALQGAHAKEVFAFDKRNILDCDTIVMALPAGRSGHIELGFASGVGKSTHILLDTDYERWDIMYQFADHVWLDEEEMRAHLLESS